MKKTRHTEDLDTAETTRRGLHSLLMMLVGSVITVMIAVFLYLSPFFDIKPPRIEPQAEVRPLPETESPDYEFYDVLPEQEFRSVPEGVSVQSRIIEGQEDSFRPDTVVSEDSVRQSTSNPGTRQQANDQDDIALEADMTTESDAQPRQDRAQSNTGGIRISQSNPNATYILQVRSYTEADDADQRRAEVIMAGVDAEVLRRKSADGQTLYQVVSMPMRTRDAAMSAYKRLQNAGIDAVIVEQKH